MTKHVCDCGTEYEYHGFVGQCPTCPKFVTAPPVRKEWFARAAEDEILDFIDSATAVEDSTN